MHGVDVWFEQVKSRIGPEMKQDLLLFNWSWRPGVVVDFWRPVGCPRFFVSQAVSSGLCPGTSVVPSRIFGMADRRDWGGGGDNPEESTQRMIERIWESLTDIQARMDQQALVPPVAVPPGEERLYL
ncbi:hypothetical protein Taro_016099 [Colocasia esculenta]|uniref:Uncharacterized protein n=1 Tax=Colocasia esculenta TaxID=4460 RepID=A0A843UD20_COLES|nr:hypothetical protein [Colocasia esculenta]